MVNERSVEISQFKKFFSASCTFRVAMAFHTYFMSKRFENGSDGIDNRNGFGAQHGRTGIEKIGVEHTNPQAAFGYRQLKRFHVFVFRSAGIETFFEFFP